MKRALLTGVALAALMGSASAADLPRRPAPVAAAPVYAPVAYNWSGFYAGLNAGYGWGNGTLENRDIGPSGGLLGGQIGWNWQIGQVVWGVETDLQWTSIDASGTCRFGRSCEVNSDWFGTLRGRVGHAWDRWMPYVTGGLAYGNLGASVTGFPGRSETNAGWTVGLGAEYAMGAGWTWKIEYLFIDLGDFDCGVRDCGGRPNFANKVDYEANVVRLGFNYRF